MCHTDQEASLKGTKHGQAANPRSPAAKLGCESCHGPGQAHVDDDAKGKIAKFKALKPAEVSATCLTCHDRGTHAGWEGSTHEARNLSCATCHSVHKPAVVHAASSSSRPRRSCARRATALQVAKTERAVAHMPVREGKMSCSSCHNPHGSISNVKALKVGSSVAESCMSCHTEMRGPMLFEHAPVRENCATCHDPHGSSNDRMLVVRMPMLCQRCHIASKHPATLYDKDQITDQQEQPDVRQIVRELPLERARLEPPVGPVLHAVAVGDCCMRRLALAPRSLGSASLRRPPRSHRQRHRRPRSLPPQAPGKAGGASRRRAPEAEAEVSRSLFEPTVAAVPDRRAPRAAYRATRRATSATRISATACCSPTSATS